MTDIIEKKYEMKNGCEIPALGLGTWQLTGKECIEIVRQAIDLGYRHIDTAELYENEEQIGQALKGFDRSKIFITSKASPKNFEKENMVNACRRSLQKLQTDYLDLYLLHWPNDNADLQETLDAVKELEENNMIRAFGLSNFDVDRIKQVISISQIPVSNLQIEYHPFTSRLELPKFCLEQRITITAYSPLARGKVFKNETIKKIAEKHQKSPAQISLKWILQKGHIVIPKASSKQHLEQNMDLFEWHLDKQDIDEIDNISQEQRLIDNKYT
jgi:diketogulonate reductase-like aldo/keto reductase